MNKYFQCWLCQQWTETKFAEAVAFEGKEEAICTKCAADLRARTEELLRQKERQSFETKQEEEP